MEQPGSPHGTISQLQVLLIFNRRVKIEYHTHTNEGQFKAMLIQRAVKSQSSKLIILKLNIEWIWFHGTLKSGVFCKLFMLGWG